MPLMTCRSAMRGATVPSTIVYVGRCQGTRRSNDGRGTEERAGERRKLAVGHPMRCDGSTRSWYVDVNEEKSERRAPDHGVSLHTDTRFCVF